MFRFDPYLPPISLSRSNEKEISHGRVSWHLEAVEPAALVGGVEHTARNQCVDPSGEIVRAGE